MVRGPTQAGRCARGALAAAVLTLLVGTGCNFKATKIDPRPWIEGSRIETGLRTLVGEDIEDSFILYGKDGIPDLEVTGWREALVVGLARGRPQRFAEPTGPSWQLVLQAAEIELIPIDWGDDGRAILFTARVTYDAMLFDPGNLPSGELKGTVQAAKPFQGVSDGSPLLSDVIGELSKELVQRTAQIVEHRLGSGEL